MQTKKKKIGIVIGRFQPFHKGHKFLILKALLECEKIFLGIGNSTGTGENDPYDWKLRKKALKQFIVSEKIEDRVINIFPLVNNSSDQVWLKNLLKKTGKIDVVVGNNEWVNGIFEDAGIPALRTGHLDRERLEGKKIRKLMKNGSEWEDRIPEYLIKIFKEK